MKSAPVIAALFVGIASIASAQAGAVLEKVVLVERHGVRPPTKAPADLAKFSQTAWPEWPVAPGELTPHGAKGIAIMGGAIRRVYNKDGLLPASGCPRDVFVWSDSSDQRTRASGDALLQGFGCTAPSQHLPPGEDDALFSPPAASLCPANPDQIRSAVEARLAAVLAAHRDDYEKSRKILQDILTPDGCGKPGQRECAVGSGDNVITMKNSEARLEGPLGTASTLSENILLEYSEGMPLADVGWGRAGDKLDDLLPLHNLYADVVRRNPALASRRGALLAQQVLDVLNGRAATFPGAVPVPSDARLVVFLGHDTNLSNLSGLLDAPWTLPGQPDATAPGTAIAFELWRQPDGRKTVTIRVFYQTPDEVRALTPITVPRAVTLQPKGCQDGVCTLPVLAAKLHNPLAPDCAKP